VRPAAARSPSSAERFAARARRRRLKRIAVGLAAVAAAAGIGAVVWLVGWSSVLAVSDVRVDGAEGRLRDRIVDVAEVPVGQPLIRVDVEAIGERVGEVADVAGVSVVRSWPRSVTIEVAARRPVAAVPDEDSWWLVDAEGVLFAESGDRPEGLPVLDASVDDSARRTRAAGVAVITSLAPAVAELVETVEAESEADITLELTSGASVSWGTAESGAEKSRVLLALIDREEGEPSDYDLSAPDRPAVGR
jgi:cell division protein FtsQ